MRLDVLIGYRGGFLHHVPKVSCHGQHSLTLTHRTFYEKDFAAHLGPCESCYYTGSLIAFLHVMETCRQPEVFFQVLRLDSHGVVQAECDLLGRHPRYFGYLLFKPPDT